MAIMAESSIVLELQRLATDSQNDISDLLRKALLVSKKLKLDDFEQWVNHELNGYTEGAVIPEYRKLRGEIKLRNPYHGLVPLMIGDSELHEILTRVEAREPIGSLAHLLTSKSPYMICPFTPEQEMFLYKGQDGIGRLPPVRTIPRNQIASLVDVVRTTVLDWACKLEAEGILGTGMTFSENEKRKAAESPQVRIENFQGVFGNIENSTVTQHLNMDVRKGDLGSLRGFLKSLKVDDADISELEAAIEEEPKPQDAAHLGSRVSGWIGKMVSKAASGAWSMSVSAGGNLLATAIKLYYGFGP